MLETRVHIGGDLHFYTLWRLGMDGEVKVIMVLPFIYFYFFYGVSTVYQLGDQIKVWIKTENLWAARKWRILER